MKVVPTPWLPAGFSAIALFPFVFVRKGVPLSHKLLNHERIHLRQQAELLVLPFYLLYLVEYIVRFIILRGPYRAYRSISFEREAYTHEADEQYLSKRKLWASFTYL